MRGLASLYGLQYARALVYMLQSVEYRIWPYLQWFWRAPDFRQVMYRRSLDITLPARLLLASLRIGMLVQVAAGAGLIIGWWLGDWSLLGWPAWQLGLALLITYPIVWAHLVVLPLALGRFCIIVPRQRAAISQSERIFANHPGIKLAIVGSYGKTSMKQLLQTVLAHAGEKTTKKGRKRTGFKVAASPTNKNVAIAHARLAESLDGDEDVVLIEYGEGRPGDVARLARQTHPTHAVITGLTPAHLDRYKTLQAAGRDIFSIAGFVSEQQLYGNAGSAAALDFFSDTMQRYDESGALGWSVRDIKVSVEGTNFLMQKGRKKLKMNSGLVGRHHVGPLVFAAAFALEAGLAEKRVVQAIATTAPVEHRMRPYRLSGAWIIDDTYNGNLEGVMAGTSLLHELPAHRKWYITPGLVDQGRETGRIHIRVGELIAAAQPDVVVLMANSVTGYIEAGLRSGGYGGRVRIETDPLHFYTNVSYFVAAGDLVMMQNDWTDNYA